jgi:hypothetical protein
MDEIKLKKNLSRLPREIINLILFYSYSCQPKYLMEDIKNVNMVKNNLLVMYKQYWEYEDNDWLINDLISYANGYNATMYGYIDNFYNIFLRHICLENVLQVDKYITSLKNLKVITQINIFLGLLTVNERNDFLKITTEDFDTY